MIPEVTPEGQAALEAAACAQLREYQRIVRRMYDDLWSEANDHINGCDLCYGSGGRHRALSCDEAQKFRKRLDRLEEALGL